MAFDMVSSNIFNFRSVRSVLIVKLKQKAVISRYMQVQIGDRQ